MINSDTIIERKYLRKKLTFWRTITIAVIAIGLLSMGSKLGAGKIAGFGAPYIARITIDDVIDRNTEREEILRELAADKNVSAVILTLNSPGGSAVGGETLYKAIKELNTKKPVVTVMDSIATSAAYLAPLGTRQIFAQQGTITGSIGVIMQMPNVKELTDKWGIKFDFVKTSPLKGSPIPFEDRNPEALAVLDRMVQDFYKYFIAIVAIERKLPPEEVLKLANGSVYSGAEAQRLKLVDQIGGEPEAKNWLIENEKLAKDIKVEDYDLSRPETPFQNFAGAISGLKNLTIIPASMKLKGVTSVWQ
jgi:protease IV